MTFEDLRFLCNPVIIVTQFDPEGLCNEFISISDLRQTYFKLEKTLFTIRSQLCWDANNAVHGNPKQRNSYQSSPTFFVLKVPLRYLRPSIIYSAPRDQIVQSKGPLHQELHLWTQREPTKPRSEKKITPWGDNVTTQEPITHGLTTSKSTKGSGLIFCTLG